MGSTVCCFTVKNKKDIDALNGYAITDDLIIHQDDFDGKNCILDESFELNDTEAESIVSNLTERYPDMKVYFFTDYLESGECVIHYYDGKQQNKFVFNDSETHDKLVSQRIGSKEWITELKNAIKEEKKRLSKTKEYICSRRKLTYQLNDWDTEQTPEEATNMYYWIEWDQHPEIIRKIIFESDFSEYSPGYLNQLESEFTVLEEFSVLESNPAFASYNGALYSKDLSELIQYPRAKKEKTYTLPKETRIISEVAFLNVENLKQLILPNPIETYQVKWEDRHADMLRLEGAPIELEYHLTPLSEYDSQELKQITILADRTV